MKIQASAMRATTMAQSRAGVAVRVLTTAASRVRGESRFVPIVAVTTTPIPPPAQPSAVEDDRLLDSRHLRSGPADLRSGNSTEEGPTGVLGGTAPPAGLRAPRDVAGAQWTAPRPAVVHAIRYLSSQSLRSGRSRSGRSDPRWRGQSPG